SSAAPVSPGLPASMSPAPNGSPLAGNPVWLTPGGRSDADDPVSPVAITNEPVSPAGPAGLVGLAGAARLGVAGLSVPSSAGAEDAPGFRGFAMPAPAWNPADTALVGPTPPPPMALPNGWREGRRGRLLVTVGSAVALLAFVMVGASILVFG